jgi:hypothetical protein
MCANFVCLFHSEDEFQAFFIREFGSAYLGDWIYAKITKIAGEFIQPEIDLLDISPLQPIQMLRAFEFKVLKSPIMGNNYNRIYAGIGQAFSYFKYGIDQSYLVIGISDNVPLTQVHILHRIIAGAGKVINQLSLNRFQIKMYREFHNEITEFPPVSPSGRFVRNSIPRGFLEDVELTRDNLCALHFPKRKGNNFFRKHNLNQYVS